MEETSVPCQLYKTLMEEGYLRDYNKRALERSTEEIFSSKEGDSTKFLLEVLFKNYNKSVKILGTSLCSKILADEKCRKTLDAFESPIKIILTDSPSYSSEKIKNYFFNNMNINSNIKETKSHIQHFTENGPKRAEFILLDDVAYFLETTFNPENIIARCSFNNPSGVLNLSKAFDEIYNKH